MQSTDRQNQKNGIKIMLGKDIKWLTGTKSRGMIPVHAAVVKSLNIVAMAL